MQHAHREDMRGQETKNEKAQYTSNWSTRELAQSLDATFKKDHIKFGQVKRPPSM